MGYVVYLVVNLLSGDLFDYTEEAVVPKVPFLKPIFDTIGEKIPYISRKRKDINNKPEDLTKSLVREVSFSDSRANSSHMMDSQTSFSRRGRETVDLFSFEHIDFIK